eukprot:906947_1
MAKRRIQFLDKLQAIPFIAKFSKKKPTPPQQSNSIVIPPKFIDQLNKTIFCKNEMEENVDCIEKLCDVSHPLIGVISTTKDYLLPESLPNKPNIKYIACVEHKDIKKNVQVMIQQANSKYDAVILFLVCIIDFMGDPRKFYDQKGNHRHIKKWSRALPFRSENNIPIIVVYNKCVAMNVGGPVVDVSRGSTHDSHNIMKHLGIIVDQKWIKNERVCFKLKSQNSSSVTKIIHSSPETDSIDVRLNVKQECNDKCEDGSDTKVTKHQLNRDAVPFMPQPTRQMTSQTTTQSLSRIDEQKQLCTQEMKREHVRDDKNDQNVEPKEEIKDEIKDEQISVSFKLENTLNEPDTFSTGTEMDEVVKNYQTPPQIVGLSMQGNITTNTYTSVYNSNTLLPYPLHAYVSPTILSCAHYTPCTYNTVPLYTHSQTHHMQQKQRSHHNGRQRRSKKRNKIVRPRKNKKYEYCQVNAGPKPNVEPIKQYILTNEWYDWKNMKHAYIYGRDQQKNEHGRLCYSLEISAFYRRCKASIASTKCINLMPIYMKNTIDHGNVAVHYVLSVSLDKRVRIGVSFVQNSIKNQNIIQVSGIHLNQNIIQDNILESGVPIDDLNLYGNTEEHYKDKFDKLKCFLQICMENKANFESDHWRSRVKDIWGQVIGTPMKM